MDKRSARVAIAEILEGFARWIRGRNNRAVINFAHGQGLASGGVQNVSVSMSVPIDDVPQRLEQLRSAFEPPKPAASPADVVSIKNDPPPGGRPPRDPTI